MAPAPTAAPPAPQRIDEDVRHLKGCPATRIERYDQRRPADQGGVLMQVTRCLECGEADYEPKEG